MKNSLLRLPEVIKLTGKSRSAIYAGINDGSFIKPIKIGERSIAFLECELSEWIDQRIEASRNSPVDPSRAKKVES